MKKSTSIIINVVLGVATLLFIIAFVLSVFVPVSTQSTLLHVLPILAICIGFIALVLSICYTRRAYELFTGLFIIFWGIIVVLLVYDILDFSLTEWWPVLGISSGFFLFLAGLFRYRKVKFGYLIPSLTLFLLGVWFMFFSFKIIKIPFKEVAIIAGPIFLICCLIFLVIILALQKKFKSFVIEDDEGGFEDDEIIGEEYSSYED